MNRRTSSVWSAATVLALAAATVPGVALAAPRGKPAPAAAASPGTTRPDDRPSPLELRRRAGKKLAVERIASGQAKAVKRHGSRVVDMGDGDWVEYQTQETHQLLTFLVEFGDTNPNPDWADITGPRQGEIDPPAPGDNSTYWKPDFDRQHYLDMFFNGMPEQGGESFRDLYQEMSSGRFDLEGDVSDWVQVDKTEASYQDGDGVESEAGMADFLQDSVNAWYDDQKAKGKTDGEIVDYLNQFDVWDRYDLDGDGNFNEPDGYIDHFQAVHAGTGEEDGTSPPWAIWSHRAAAGYDPSGTVGPADYPRVGGVRIGNTDKWVFDYTTEPENGALGVFAHEFGHDLGLPDFYDTSSYASDDNGVDFWSLMSAGSWLSHGEDGPGAGTTPNQMDAYSKLLLGWLDYEVVDPLTTEQVTLGPSFHATRSDGRVLPQAAYVDLPDSEAFIPTGTGYGGSRGYLYSGRGDSRISAIESPAFTVPTGAQLTARAAYNIEEGWDYAYVEVSADDGASWDPIHITYGEEEGAGITGYSKPGSDPSAIPTTWADLVADLSAYQGQSVRVRFRNVNDGRSNAFGLKVDDIAVGSLRWNFDNGAQGWTSNWSKEGPVNAEFYVVVGTGYFREYKHFYLAENRTYAGYDRTLGEGPYNPTQEITDPNKVQWFGFQDGLLIWHVTHLADDNNTSEHPGWGQALIVDAHPKALRWANGDVARSRFQTHDATFGLRATQPLSLTRQLPAGTTTLHAASMPAVATFDDSVVSAYYDPAKPDASSYVGGTGTSITVLSENRTAGRVTLQVAPVAPRALVRPTVRGTARVGARLTATPGDWTLSPSLKYQWLANGAPIAGATGSAYTLRPAQAGATISVRVTATSPAHPAGSATSASTARVQPAPVALSVRAPKKVKRGKKATVRVTVTSPGLVPAGTVTIRYGGKLVAAKRLAGGVVTVKLPKQRKKGKKKLVVAYTPAVGFSGTRRTLTIKVK